MAVQDRPGLLGEIASALGAKGINVRGVYGWAERGEGLVCLVVDKLSAASRVLAARGLTPEEEDVLEVSMPNKPGMLGEAARRLGDAGVNIKYVFVGTEGGRRATVFFAVTDLGLAMKALR